MIYLHLRRLKIAARLLAVLFYGPSACFAGGTENFAGDFEPLSPGTQIASFFYFDRHLEGYYLEGEKILGGAKLKGQAAVAGYSNYFALAGKTAAVTLFMPYISGKKSEGNLPPGHGEHFSGWSDPRVRLTLWPHQSEQRALALSTTLVPPLGEYKHTQAFNTGDHRWKTTLQLGWIEHLSTKWSVELIPEVTFYGNNEDYIGRTLSQANAYAITGFVRWRPVYGIEPYVGFQTNTGGEQTINGVDQNNQTMVKRMYAGVNAGLSKHWVAGLRYMQDTDVENELKVTADWALQLHYVF